MLVLSGSFEVTAGGETRTFSSGELLLAEDTTGPGHATTIITESIIAVVQL
jgi:hypothetical protein